MILQPLKNNSIPNPSISESHVTTYLLICFACSIEGTWTKLFRTSSSSKRSTFYFPGGYACILCSNQLARIVLNSAGVSANSRILCIHNSHGHNMAIKKKCSFLCHILLPWRNWGKVRFFLSTMTGPQPFFELLECFGFPCWNQWPLNDPPGSWCAWFPNSRSEKSGTFAAHAACAGLFTKICPSWEGKVMRIFLVLLEVAVPPKYHCCYSNWWFFTNPIWKISYSQIGSSAQVGMHIIFFFSCHQPNQLLLLHAIEIIPCVLLCLIQVLKWHCVQLRLVRNTEYLQIAL